MIFHRTKHPLMIAMISLLMPLVVPAATIDFQFERSVLPGRPGDVLTFRGELRNHTGGDLWINGAAINIDSAEASSNIDLLPFIIYATGLMSDGATIGPVDVFSITIPDVLASRSYTGMFVIQGGMTLTDDATLASAVFQVSVESPEASIPELGTAYLILSATLIGGARHVLRIVGPRSLQWLLIRLPRPLAGP